MFLDVSKIEQNVFHQMDLKICYLDHLARISLTRCTTRRDNFMCFKQSHFVTFVSNGAETKN